MIKTKILAKESIENRDDFRKASEIFNNLVQFMQSNDIQEKLETTHQLHAKSGEIQNIILEKTKELGFSSEKKGLFNNQPVRQLRPDYYLALKNNS